MSDPALLLRHFLATLAYRTRKALRDAPESFGDYRAIPGVRTPRELLRHMTSVLGFARRHFTGETYRAERLPSLAAEVERFHEMLADLSARLERREPHEGITETQLLQGPFADAMTHAGQLAMLRRFAGAPVPPEDFSRARIDPDNVSLDQPEAASPDREWLDAEDEAR